VNPESVTLTAQAKPAAETFATEQPNDSLTSTPEVGAKPDVPFAVMFEALTNAVS